MRRGCSLTLFVIGGWILSIVGIVAMISGELGRISGGEFVAPWKIAAFFVAVALPFLLIGTWISPGRRIAELGLTLMIAFDAWQRRSIAEAEKHPAASSR